jgi:4'-phosphopantetheinyl transferase EntD
MTLITDQFSVSSTIAVAYCSIGSMDRQSELTAQEKVILDSRSNEKTKISFLAGRLAAHEALCSQGKNKEVLAIETGGQRLAPYWLGESFGSIAHTTMSENQHSAVAVVSADDSPVGIDIEPLTRVVKPQLLNRITSEQERGRLPISKSPHITLEIFCIKEALYKTLWPVVQRSISFTDTIVDYHTGSISLSSSLSAHPQLTRKRFVYQSIQYEGTLITLVSTLAM